MTLSSRGAWLFLWLEHGKKGLWSKSLVVFVAEGLDGAFLAGFEAYGFLPKERRCD